MAAHKRIGIVMLAAMVTFLSVDTCQFNREGENKSVRIHAESGTRQPAQVNTCRVGGSYMAISASR